MRAAAAALLAGALLAGALLAAPSAVAQPHRGADPDWPCVQRLVPRLTAGALWAGPQAEGDWHAEPEVAALVARITPRRVEEPDGLAAIAEFVAPLDAAARRRLLPLVFAGLLDQTNTQRDGLIEHIRRFTRRQRELAEISRDIAAELRTLPETAPPERRAELEQRRAFTAKAFGDAERTLRYACEAPVRLEGRLGTYGRALQAALPQD
jgi:hypothetical protein